MLQIPDSQRPLQHIVSAWFVGHSVKVVYSGVRAIHGLRAEQDYMEAVQAGRVDPPDPYDVSDLI